MHGLAFGVPVVKGSRDTNVPGRGMSGFEAKRFKLRPLAHDIVVILVVFHIFFSCFDPANLRANARRRTVRATARTSFSFLASYSIANLVAGALNHSIHATSVVYDHPRWVLNRSEERRGGK